MTVPDNERSDNQYPVESLALARLAAEIADDKQGLDTIVLPVGKVLSITEFFVITSASNRRLVRAIADEVEQRVREATGRSPGRVEGQIGRAHV